ncbi:expressed unknown protein [Seminavis robusta]|uniref:Uncharacterized protein n=1 Tax=Seminavis robusta TaxID=568900 RepID=A0A9N8HCF7_9STRA|nr:expressed unknown protein [Seminavis robusta]|eukprot:Sro216_g089440.1 n/a (270) ;mRNA; r:58029-58838
MIRFWMHHEKRVASHETTRTYLPLQNCERATGKLFASLFALLVGSNQRQQVSPSTTRTQDETMNIPTSQFEQSSPFLTLYEPFPRKKVDSSRRHHHNSRKASSKQQQQQQPPFPWFHRSHAQLMMVYPTASAAAQLSSDKNEEGVPKFVHLFPQDSILEDDFSALQDDPRDDALDQPFDELDFFLKSRRKIALFDDDRDDTNTNDENDAARAVAATKRTAMGHKKGSSKARGPSFRAPPPLNKLESQESSAVSSDVIAHRYMGRVLYEI